jgi:hypothetical protein
LKALDLTKSGVLLSTTYSSRKSETVWSDLSNSKSSGVVPHKSSGLTSVKRFNIKSKVSSLSFVLV